MYSSSQLHFLVTHVYALATITLFGQADFKTSIPIINYLKSLSPRPDYLHYLKKSTHILYITNCSVPDGGLKKTMKQVKEKYRNIKKQSE